MFGCLDGIILEWIELGLDFFLMIMRRGEKDKGVEIVCKLMFIIM